MPTMLGVVALLASPGAALAQTLDLAGMNVTLPKLPQFPQAWLTGASSRPVSIPVRSSMAQDVSR
jgi:hypothetical protein